ncbi:thiamine pyrophosphate-dependent enzyme [Roseomonas sp. CCTCC AB2023176]|uniref:thiamine pyrophosphate-dependent enzyme n=1 Tax=Roseomonas sp. CCTCC AB2023176 TaxID=3342640 RepID=UPI0035E1D000
MERSFAKEVALLRKGAGEVVETEGILAIAKALLQSGVSYVTGYQGAPVSHLMDVFADAKPLLDELGVHYAPAANEAGAASMLAASINYPVRGAAVWKSTVGTNVASDALSNLASAGVKGGVVMVVGEDYGEGASIIQERTHAFCTKSSMWLLDPRPDHPRLVDLIEKAFQLSEVSNTPVMAEVRIRACHLRGRFTAKDNIQPAISTKDPLTRPDFDYGRICLPPSTYLQEQDKVNRRFPAARAFIRDHALNDHLPGDLDEVGIIVQGGHTNTLLRALSRLDLADAFGNTRIPVLALNVCYPLVPEEVTAFCAGKRAVLIVEEGNPAYIEESIAAALREADLNTKVIGKKVLPLAGEYTNETVLRGLARFLEGTSPRGVDTTAVARIVAAAEQPAERSRQLIGAPLPQRPPGFCTGCPERPVFAAMKLVQKQVGEVHVAADIGCHSFATLPPFNMGSSILGYGLGLSSAAAVSGLFGDKRTITVMGDGGFWHNGLSTGVTAALQNKTDGVLVVMDNGYTSATGQQHILSTKAGPADRPHLSIEDALRALGVTWIKTQGTYRVKDMVRTLHSALTTKQPGLKVIIAQQECQLARQRRIKPMIARDLKAGKRVIRTRYGVDAMTCTGDHSCIRLSGCPSLTIKENPDPLRRDPVAHVNQDCVGCGLCGEVADAAQLCPSFYRADIIQNPRPRDLWLARIRNAVITRLQAWAERRRPATAAMVPAE